MNLSNRDWDQTYRVMTSPLRLEPDFIIAGEAKCGTTSLYRYIVAHPDILPADRKEPNNFITYPDSMTMCRSHYPLQSVRLWRKNVLRRDFVTGEASAEYFSRRNVAENIATKLPGVRIIIMLRDPVQRALSDWNMLNKNGILRDSFEDIVDRSIDWLSDYELRPVLDDAGQHEHSAIRIVLRGIYINNLQRWKHLFDQEHLRVYPSEELFRNPQSVTDDIYHFLKVGPYTLPEQTQYRKGDYDTGKYIESLRKLALFYAPYNEELFNIIGRRLPWGGASDY